MTDPHHGYDMPGYDERGNIHDVPGRSQFPKRWEPLRGSYVNHNYSPRGQFGPREAGSTLAFSAAIQPAIVFASYQIEQLAERSNPAMSDMQSVGVFGAAWGSQFVIAVVFKLLAGLLRNFGESLIRDIGSWLWLNVFESAWHSFSSLFLWWLPQRQPTGRRVPNSDPNPRQPVRDWWHQRRHNRRNRGNR